MIYNLKEDKWYSEIKIKEGETEFECIFPLEKEDYGISASANWDTTIPILEKRKGYFKLEFSKKCPEKGGTLYLNILSQPSP